ncbi:hypothetical protein PHISP_08789, partial [Aspergillus sp. HF37]
SSQPRGHRACLEPVDPASQAAAGLHAQEPPEPYQAHGEGEYPARCRRDPGDRPQQPHERLRSPALAPAGPRGASSGRADRR